MKSKKEWNQAILNITMKIHEEFPELSKYIKEMPVKISENNKDEIDNKSLKDYYNSLLEMVNEYAKSHQAKKIKNENSI